MIPWNFPAIDYVLKVSSDIHINEEYFSIQKNTFNADNLDIHTHITYKQAISKSHLVE